MLVIRAPQFEAFEKAAIGQFERRMLGYLTESFPKQAGLLGPAQMRRVISLGRERAVHYGHQTEREIYFYLTLMLMLGSFFDEDPQLPWAAERLADQSIAHPPARLNRLHSDTMAYLDRVCGENNEHLVKALMRIRDFDPASAGAIPPEQFEDEMVRTLSRFFPQKAAYQGESATRAVVRGAAVLARRHAVSDQRHLCLLAGLGFMLGSGFHRDPQFPWAQEALPPGRPANPAALLAQAHDYLEQGLK
jgi:hypothetical protein